MKIAYLGPKGTYSEKAAAILGEKLPKSNITVPKTSLETVAKTVATGETELGVMAYYNQREGLVQECLDLIYEYELSIIGMHRLPVVFTLGGFPGDAVYSHPKALAQCSEYLQRYYPDLPHVTTTSTAEAVRMVKTKGSGLVIAGRDTIIGYELDVLADDIGNRRHGKVNFTDFYLVSKTNGASLETGKNYLTMIAVTPHFDEPGLLANILSQVAYYGLNNAKIHSRPALDEVHIGIEPQMFYLEIMAHQESDDFKRCVESLRHKLKSKNTVRVLGSYERP
jgi:prephenate dehydratase